MKRWFNFLFVLMSLQLLNTASAATWYVRPDGGTRYSTVMTSGQCDGLADTAYPGSGVNQHCAFNSFQFLYQDGSYATTFGDNGTFPHWGWVIAGGDTVIVRGSIGTGVTYRIGWNNQTTAYDSQLGYFVGLVGDPYSSHPPTPPAGTAEQPTRILGENYAACSTPAAKTQLRGGHAVGTVLQMTGASYVDVECLDISDFSNCGRASQQVSCNTDIGSLTDFANIGVLWDNQANHDTLKNVHIHGLGGFGMYGPTGDGVVMSGIDILGNPLSGWNTDTGDGQTGVGSLLVQNYNISWNGCAEEYPVAHALPYYDCTDDNSGGYGDGFGTATVLSSKPWNIVFDQGTASYNTQDGLDLLHLSGAGSTADITRTSAFGNMGQQIKNGGANGVLENSVITGNCTAMQNNIPGTPSGFNNRLSDFCRASDTPVVISTGKNGAAIYRDNTLFSSNSIGVLMLCDYANGPCDETSRADFRNNIFVGSIGPYEDDFPTPVYILVGSDKNPFLNAGSFYASNITYHAKSNWACPATWIGEQAGICSDPALKDETQKAYGSNDATPLQGSLAIGSGLSLPGLTLDFNGSVRANPTSRGAIDPAGTPSDGSTTTPTSPSGPPTQPSGPIPTTTQLTASLPGGSGSDVVLSAQVQAASGDAAPTGRIVLYNSHNFPAGSAILKGGAATWNLPQSMNSESFHASYAAQGGFAGSASSVISIPAILQGAN